MSATVFDEEEVRALVVDELAQNYGALHSRETLNMPRKPSSRSTHDSQPASSNHSDQNDQGNSNGTVTSPILLGNSTDENSFNEESNEWGNEMEGQDGKSTLKPEFEFLPWRQRPSYRLVRIVLFIQILGQMSSVTSLLDAMVYLICQHHFKNLDPVSFTGIGSATEDPIWASGKQSFDDPRCFGPEISALVSIFHTYMTTLTAILSVFIVPYLASWSDRIGRRPILLWTMSCGILSLMITMICCTFPNQVNYKLFLVSAVLDGIGGSMGSMVVLCTSYTSDTIKDSFRAGALSILDACMFGGIAVGPLVGSFILSYTDHNLLGLFSFSMACQVFALLLMIFVVRESRSETARHKSLSEHLSRRKSFLINQRRRLSINDGDETTSSQNWTTGFVEKTREIFHYLNILGPLKVLRFSHIRDRRSRFNVFVLIMAQATLSEVVMASMPLVLLFSKVKFGWTSVENGYFISFLGFSRFFILSTIIPMALNIARRTCSHSATQVDAIDKRLVQVGLLFSVLGYFVLAEAPTESVFLGSVLIMALGSGASPLLRNAIIKHAPKDKVGEVLGAGVLIARLENIFVPAIFATLYSKTVRYRAQAIIEVIMATEFLMLVLLSCMYIQGPDTIDDVERLVSEEEEI